MLFQQRRPAWSLIAILAGFFVVSGFYIYFCSANDIFEFSGDASGYLLAAQYFSPFQTATPMLQAYSREIIYPPLFPLIIGVFGGTALAGRLVVVASVLGSFLMLYSWLRSENLRQSASAATVLLIALMPITYVTALNTWTENTYLLFSLAAVSAVSHAETPNRWARHYWLAGSIAVALATLTRVAAAPLLAAFCLYVAIRRPAGYLRFIMIAALPFCIWAIIAKSRQVGLGGYTSQWWDLYQADAINVLLRTMSEWIKALAFSWKVGFVGDVGGTPFPVIVGFVGVVGVIGWADRLRHFKFDALYVLCYMAMLLAWPHPEEASRYGYVMAPFLIAYAVLLLAKIDEKLKGRVASFSPVFILLTICIAMVIPSLVVNVLRYNRPVPEDLKDVRKMDGWYSDDGLMSEYITPLHLRIITHLKSLARQVPESDCIFSVKSTVVQIHTGRSSFAIPLNNASDGEFDEALRRCKYAYVVNLSFSNRPGFYPLQRLGQRANVISEVRMGEGSRSHRIGALIEILPK